MCEKLFKIISSRIYQMPTFLCQHPIIIFVLQFTTTLDCKTMAQVFPRVHYACLHNPVLFPAKFAVFSTNVSANPAIFDFFFHHQSEALPIKVHGLPHLARLWTVEPAIE